MAELELVEVNLKNAKGNPIEGSISVDGMEVKPNKKGTYKILPGMIEKLRDASIRVSVIGGEPEEEPEAGDDQPGDAGNADADPRRQRLDGESDKDYAKRMKALDKEEGK